MGKIFAAAILLAVPLSVTAAPATQLECRLPAGAGETLWLVTLREADGAVDLRTAPGTEAFTRPARYTAEQVKFTSFSIDRSDGTFTRKDGFSGLSVLVRGMCSPAPETAMPLETVSRRTGP